MKAMGLAACSLVASAASNLSTARPPAALRGLNGCESISCDVYYWMECGVVDNGCAGTSYCGTCDPGTSSVHVLDFPVRDGSYVLTANTLTLRVTGMRAVFPMSDLVLLFTAPAVAEQYAVLPFTVSTNGKSGLRLTFKTFGPTRTNTSITNIGYPVKAQRVVAGFTGEAVEDLKVTVVDGEYTLRAPTTDGTLELKATVTAAQGATGDGGLLDQYRADPLYDSLPFRIIFASAGLRLVYKEKGAVAEKTTITLTEVPIKAQEATQGSPTVVQVDTLGDNTRGLMDGDYTLYAPYVSTGLPDGSVTVTGVRASLGVPGLVAKLTAQEVAAQYDAMPFTVSSLGFNVMQLTYKLPSQVTNLRRATLTRAPVPIASVPVVEGTEGNVEIRSVKVNVTEGSFVLAEKTDGLTLTVATDVSDTSATLLAKLQNHANVSSMPFDLSLNATDAGLFTLTYKEIGEVTDQATLTHINPTVFGETSVEGVAGKVCQDNFCEVGKTAEDLLQDCQDKSEEYTDVGYDYTGCQSTTISGRSCQRWSSMVPHQHAYAPNAFPDAGLGDHNFCRNPQKLDVGIWCITEDPEVLWEECRPIGTPWRTPRVTSDPALEPDFGVSTTTVEPEEVVISNNGTQLDGGGSGTAITTEDEGLGAGVIALIVLGVVLVVVVACGGHIIRRINKLRHPEVVELVEDDDVPEPAPEKVQEVQRAITAVKAEVEGHLRAAKWKKAATRMSLDPDAEYDPDQGTMKTRNGDLI
mmetsp:Transcript_104297/g.238816  ORF Transcript_104297/g.238816 Transcript_104297/m.238816 type:complete len:750 (+) Transcript_104297:66-2315(+)